MLRHVNSLHLAYILVFAELTSFVQRIHVVELSLKYRFIAAYKGGYNMVYRSNYRLDKTIGHVNNIPTMHFFRGISRNTQSKLYMLSLTECVWDFQHNALWDTH
mgnify:CR=1 FL=1